MIFMSSGQVDEWCKLHGLKLTPEKFLYYGAEDAYCFSIDIDDKASNTIQLADYLVPTWEEVPFFGALLWIRERGIWGDFPENTGLMVLTQMRLGRGETESIEERPGHLFGQQELVEMHSYFVIPMLFGWDAFLIPENRDYFIFVSHDGFAGVVCKTAKTYEDIYYRVRDWNPRKEKQWYFKRLPSMKSSEPS